jgi:regulator of PEP synthase PpsR (kinase-PPPase family)
VYTLAEKLGIPTLKSLAHSKIHRINSTSRGELEYARYVYANTKSDDVTIRKPVSNFWGRRSHILRHEVEEEFRQLCLDVPQFCFDVLSVVLDQGEKRAQNAAETEFAVRGSGRKRLRSDL